MKLTSLLAVLGTALLFMGCGTTVQTTMKKSWEKEIAIEEGYREQTQFYLENGGEAVTLVTPLGVQTIDSNGETAYKMDRDKLFRMYVNTSRGVEEITDKITYMYLPHRHSLLEFNYSMAAESVTMIDLDSKEIAWINNDLKWSLERYQLMVRAASKGLSLLGGATANAASQVLMPKRFVRNLTTVVPELDAMLFKTLDGLQLISLESGEVLWTNEEIKGGIAKMFYDSATNSIVVVNSDDEAFKVSGLQFNKQIARIDAEDGSTIWTNSYDGNIREKLDGIGIWADRKVDVRLMGDFVMLNFLSVELFDFKTGDKLWQTSEGANKLLDLVAPESQIMNQFAFPVIHNNMLYRVGFENVGLTGIDVIIEAFDLDTGDLVWKSDKISRSDPVNNMEVIDDRLIVSISDSKALVAFDVNNGKRLWEYDKFGRRGVQHHTHQTDEGLVAAGGDRVALIDPKSGEDLFSIDTGADGLGDVSDVQLLAEGMVVSGDDGFALYDDATGKQIQKVITPTGGLITANGERLLVIPKPNYSDVTYPVDGAFYIINPADGKLLGTLGTDKNRRDWKIDENYESIYVLSGNKIEKYEAQ